MDSTILERVAEILKESGIPKSEDDIVSVISKMHPSRPMREINAALTGSSAEYEFVKTFPNWYWGSPCINSRFIDSASVGIPSFAIDSLFPDSMGSSIRDRQDVIAIYESTIDGVINAESNITKINGVNNFIFTTIEQRVTGDIKSTIYVDSEYITSNGKLTQYQKSIIKNQFEKLEGIGYKIYRCEDDGFIVCAIKDDVAILAPINDYSNLMSVSSLRSAFSFAATRIDVNKDQPPTDLVETIDAIICLERASSSVESDSRSKSELINHWTGLLNEAQRTIAEFTRKIEDTREEIKNINKFHIDYALKNAISSLDVSSVIANMRQVKSCNSDIVNGSTIIKLETYPFDMIMEGFNGSEDCGCGDCSWCEEDDTKTIRLGPFNIKIDTSLDINHEDSIVIDVDSSYYCIHPHIDSDGIICWGYARNSIAEAWGRRDWESVVRIILAWITKFNMHDAYNQGQEILDEGDNMQVYTNGGWHVNERTTTNA